jgi:hypothetical protein
MTRKSVSLYYYTAGVDHLMAHDTRFVSAR